MKNNNYKSFIDPYYENGDFFLTSPGEIDAEFKVEQLFKIVKCNKNSFHIKSGKVADVGCGTGKTTFLLQKALSELVGKSLNAYGFDVHPFIDNIVGNEHVHFQHGDFCKMNHEEIYDLVVLFDVIEHIIDPISFISDVSRTCRKIAFHIPLDDSFFTWFRDMPKSKLLKPGHIVNLDASSALNMLAYSGLRVVDYMYSPVYKSPSNNKNLPQQIMNIIRGLSFKFSPYLTQKLFAGIGLIILANTRFGLLEE